MEIAKSRTVAKSRCSQVRGTTGHTGPAVRLNAGRQMIDWRTAPFRRMSLVCRSAADAPGRSVRPNFRKRRTASGQGTPVVRPATTRNLLVNGYLRFVAIGLVRCFVKASLIEPPDEDCRSALPTLRCDSAIVRNPCKAGSRLDAAHYDPAS